MRTNVAKTKTVEGIVLTDPVETQAGLQYPSKDVFLDELRESESNNPTVPYCWSCGRVYASNRHFTSCLGCGWKSCGHPKCNGKCDCDVHTADLLDEMDAQYGNLEKRMERASLQAEPAPSSLECPTDAEFPEAILNRMNTMMNTMLMCNMLEELREIRKRLDQQAGE